MQLCDVYSSESKCVVNGGEQWPRGNKWGGYRWVAKGLHLYLNCSSLTWCAMPPICIVVCSVDDCLNLCLLPVYHVHLFHGMLCYSWLCQVSWCQGSFVFYQPLVECPASMSNVCSATWPTGCPIDYSWFTEVHWRGPWIGLKHLNLTLEICPLNFPASVDTGSYYVRTSPRRNPEEYMYLCILTHINKTLAMETSEKSNLMQGSEKALSENVQK